METIQEYVTAPWEECIPLVIDHDKERAAQMANCLGDIRIATSSSCRYGIVGIGIAISDTSYIHDRPPTTFSITLGARTEQNPYTAELAAIAKAMSMISLSLFTRRQIIIATSNQAALKAISKPHHQSGQSDLCQIYETFRLL
jgi:ribonuclease HI